MFFICTAIILDPSEDGGSYYDAGAATWTSTFSYGTVSGIASCNSIEGTSVTAYSGNQNDITQGYQNGQVNCWCRMTSPIRSAWMNAGKRESCAAQCVTGCAYYMGRSDFRTIMYGTAGN